MTLDGEILYRRADIEDHDFLGALYRNSDSTCKNRRSRRSFRTSRASGSRTQKGDPSRQERRPRPLLAVGGEELRRGLPSALLEAVTEMYGEPTRSRSPSSRSWSRAARLQEYREVLETAGLDPPAGGPVAVPPGLRARSRFPDRLRRIPLQPTRGHARGWGRLRGPLHEYQEDDRRSLPRADRGGRKSARLVVAADWRRKDACDWRR